VSTPSLTLVGPGE